MFSPTYNGERFFFCTERHERYLCQCRIFFFPGIYLHAFFLSKSVCMTFFCELTHNPLKSQIVGTENPPNIWSVDRF